MHIPQVPLKFEVSLSVDGAHVTRIDAHSINQCIELVIGHVDPVDGRVHALRLNARGTKLVDTPNNHVHVREAKNIDDETLFITRVLLQFKFDPRSGSWEHERVQMKKLTWRLQQFSTIHCRGYNHPLQSRTYERGGTVPRAGICLRELLKFHIISQILGRRDAHNSVA